MGRTHYISALVTFIFALQLCLHPCDCFSPTKEFFMKHKWDNITNSLTSGTTKGFFNDHELTTYLKNLHKNFPDLVSKLETIGKTVENKDIYSLVLTSQPPSNPSIEKKPRILFTGFLHGTDFMSTAALLHLANYLIYGYLHKQPDATYLLQNREVWIVPAINLDSYTYVSDYVKTHNRTYLITKNRRENDPADICGDSAIGVNLNRNFDINFDSLDVIPGAQTKYDPKSAEYICRPYYRGDKPFSEPETAAIRDLLNQYTFELGINLMGIGPKFILPQAFAENINTRLFYESIQAECPFPTGTAFGTRYVISKEVFNGEMMDYMFQKKNVISASYMIGINEKGYEGYFPTIPKMKRLLNENLDSLLYFIYKSGENLRIEELWQSSCYADTTQCGESKDARYYFQLKVSNSGLQDFSQNPSILLRFSNEEAYNIEQIFLNTSNNERKQIDFTTITQNDQLFYKIEGPSLKKGESFVLTPIIVRTSSASFGRFSEIPSDEPQHFLAYIQENPNTHISHLKALIKHPNFDIEEMVAKKLATKKLIITSGICLMSTLFIGLGGWIIVKYFKKQPKSHHQFTKLDDTSQSSRDIEGQIEMTKQNRKNKHKEDFDDVHGGGHDRPKRKSKKRSESGSGSSQSRERSPDKPKSKTKQPKESKSREGSKEKRSRKKYSQLNKEDDDDLRDIEIHHKKAN